MKYIISNGFVMANGATHSCIYDLRNTWAKIHRINKKANDFIRTLTTQDDVYISEEDKPFLSKLIENSILTKTQDNSYKKTLKPLKKTNRTAWIEVTEKCQLKCSYCYGSFGAKKRNTLNPEDFDKLVEQLQLNDFSIFRIIGGEPLLNIGIVQILVLKLSQINNSRIEIFTNGLLITEEFLLFCLAHKVKLAIGIFGANEMECINVTGAKNVFKRHQKIIDLVRSSGVAYSLSITRSETNNSATKEELANIYSFPVDLLRQDKVKQVGRAENQPTPFDKQVKSIQKEYFSGRFASSFILENIQGGHSCYKNKICITSSLDVHPCIMERSITYGNLHQRPLIDILELGMPYISASKDTVDTCKDCEYRYACFDCRVNRQSGGGFFAKSSNCGYNPHTGNWVE